MISSACGNWTITTTTFAPEGTGSLVSPVVVYQHDSTGNVVSITDATGGVTTFGYDDLGRKISETDPDPDGAGPLVAPVTRYAYDKANNLVSVSDALGHTTQYAYDARNRRVAILDAEGGLTTFAYDDVGNMLSLTDPVGNTTTWVYDNLNRVISETNELGYTRYFAYDPAGRQIEKTDRNGRVTQYGYDSSDNLTSEIWYSSTADAAGHQNATNEIHWQYDSAGRLLSESDNYSSSTYTYDDQNRRTSETISNLNSVIVVLTTGYARADNLRTSLSVTIGGVADLQQTFEYTSTGLLTHIGQSAQTGGNAVATIGIDLAYDSLGRLVQLDRFQGTSFVAGSTWQYDSQNRLVALTHAQGQNVLAGYTWTYDTAGRLTDATSPDGPVHYSYDDTDQLTGADYENTQQSDESYQWDANGNRANPGWVTGPNNQLLSDGTFWYSYDPEGNRTTRFIWTDSDNDGLVDDGERSQITEYSWDNRNRLTRVSERASDNGPLTQAIDYLYDTENRWIGRIADLDGTGPETADILHFVYDDKQVLFQQDASGTVTRRYLWNPAAVDQLLAQEEVTATTEPGEVQWALTDHLGSVRDLAQYNVISSATQVIVHRVFNSFGNLVSETGAATGQIFAAYAGRPFDPISRIQNNVSRWFDPVVPSWTGEDPISYAAKGTNLRAYVNNSPLGSRDPTGLFTADNHSAITRKALSAIVPEKALAIIIEGNLAQDEVFSINLTMPILDSNNHVDANQFQPAFRDIQARLSAASKVLTDRQVLRAFGRSAHTLQDLYAHSNYVEVMDSASGRKSTIGTLPIWPGLLGILSNVPASPEGAQSGEFSLVNPKGHRFYQPGFGPVDPKSHEAMNKDTEKTSAGKATNLADIRYFDLAFDLAVRTTTEMWKRFYSQLSESMQELIRNM